MHASGGSILLVEVHGEDCVPSTGDFVHYLGGICNTFNGQHFPESVVQKKALEFATLTQKDDSVRDYSKNFLQLERFAPGSLATVRAREDKFL